MVSGAAAGRSERGGLRTAAMGDEQQLGGAGRHGPGQRHQRLKLCKYKLVRLEVGSDIDIAAAGDQYYLHNILTMAHQACTK